MAKMTRKMTSVEFGDLMCSIENGEYRCTGFSHNCNHTQRIGMESVLRVFRGV